MAGDMRIVMIGQEAFGGKVLEALAEQGENVVGAFVPPDREGRPLDPLKVAAQERDIPVLQFRRMRAQEAIDVFKTLKADLGVMAFVTDIVPDEILEAPAKGTIQYHPSLLPKHRGPSSINWPIIMGSTKTGLSIFWPDNGLDTGPILLQKEVEIGPDDSLGSIYFNQLFPMGVAALLEGVDLVRDGKAPRIVQDESKQTYESWCRKDDAEIDWSKPAAEVYNLIRGTNPQPGAWTLHDGKVLQIFDRASCDAAGGAPGEVIAIDESGITVAAGGGAVLVKRVRPEGEKKIAASDFVASAGLAVGAKFG